MSEVICIVMAQLSRDLKKQTVAQISEEQDYNPGEMRS